jgi:hypothetical protein
MHLARELGGSCLPKFLASDVASVASKEEN